MSRQQNSPKRKESYVSTLIDERDSKFKVLKTRQKMEIIEGRDFTVKEGGYPAIKREFSGLLKEIVGDQLYEKFGQYGKYIKTGTTTALIFAGFVFGAESLRNNREGAKVATLTPYVEQDAEKKHTTRVEFAEKPHYVVDPKSKELSVTYTVAVADLNGRDVVNRQTIPLGNVNKFGRDILQNPLDFSIEDHRDEKFRNLPYLFLRIDLAPEAGKYNKTLSVTAGFLPDANGDLVLVTKEEISWVDFNSETQTVSGKSRTESIR